MTGWQEFKDLDLKKIKERLRTPTVIDGVNILDPDKARAAGLTYIGVGRVT